MTTAAVILVLAAFLASAVEAVRAEKGGGPKVAGFANAVLRKLAKDPKYAEPAK